MIQRLAGIILLAVAMPSAAVAQQAPRAYVEAGATNDYRVRGLSWSGGKAAVQGGVSVDLPAGFNAGLWAASTRHAARHGGADAAVDAVAGYRKSSGPWRLEAAILGKFFPGGAGARDYVETHVSVGNMIGPVDLRLGANYAPDQRALGGDNLYLRASARLAVIGTPLTLTAHAGRSSGGTDEPLKAFRLRPGGTYHDWSLGADYSMGPIIVGLAYTDTDIDIGGTRGPGGERLHAGSRLAASLRFVL